jgi:hypothetical protein
MRKGAQVEEPQDGVAYTSLAIGVFANVAVLLTNAPYLLMEGHTVSRPTLWALHPIIALLALLLGLPWSIVELRQGKRLAALGIVLSLTPLFVGAISLRLIVEAKGIAAYMQ